MSYSVYQFISTHLKTDIFLPLQYSKSNERMRNPKETEIEHIIVKLFVLWEVYLKTLSHGHLVFSYLQKKDI